MFTRSAMWVFTFFAVLFTSLAAPLQAAPNIIPREPTLNASAYLLIDATSGEVLVEKNADEPLPPASLTKMMTSYVIASELAKGRLSEEDDVQVSVEAWRTPGSKMFIREGTTVKVRDLINGIVIQSGNDACVAMAEHIAGAEDAFSDVMNSYAKELGLNNSHFKNSTGLPAEDHYTTARDLAKLAKALIQNFPEHYKIYAQKEFTFNGIRQTNRNSLLWSDSSVDGIKTGYTEEAGYCLVSSAVREGMRLISVVLGTDSPNTRKKESQKLLAYGFRYFENVKVHVQDEVLLQQAIWKGQKNTVELGLDDALYLTLPRGQKDNIQEEFKYPPILEAPIKAGDQVGTLTVKLDDRILVERPLLALETIEEAGFFKRLWDSIKLFFHRLFSGSSEEETPVESTAFLGRTENQLS